MDLVFAVIIVTLATYSIFRLNTVTPIIRITFSRDEYLDSHLKYQILLLILASVVLVLTYFLNPINFSLLLSVGNITAPAKPVEWFEIGPNRSWLFVGLYLTVIITLGTFTFVYLQYRHVKISMSQVLPYMGCIVFVNQLFFRRGDISHRYHLAVHGDCGCVIYCIDFGCYIWSCPFWRHASWIDRHGNGRFSWLVSCQVSYGNTWHLLGVVYTFCTRCRYLYRFYIEPY